MATMGIALAAGLTGCGSSTYSYRYKLTIEAVVNGVTKTAASVGELFQNVDIYKTHHVALRGEALYLDLGPGQRPLIALLSARPKNGASYAPCQWGEGGPGCLSKLYNVNVEWDLEAKRLNGFRELAKQRGPREITVDRLPDLVTFTDIDDPKTVVEVDPNNPGEALNCSFEWKKITLEITDEPVTTGIEKKLKWVNALPGNLAGNKRKTETEFATMLDVGSFKQGTSQ